MQNNTEMIRLCIDMKNFTGKSHNYVSFLSGILLTVHYRTKRLMKGLQHVNINPQARYFSKVVPIWYLADLTRVRFV